MNSIYIEDSVRFFCNLLSVIRVIGILLEEMELQSRNLAELKQTFRNGRTRGVGWRKAQLRALLKLLEEKEDEIFEALRKDLGKHPVESYRDEVSFQRNLFLFFFNVNGGKIVSKMSFLFSFGFGMCSNMFESCNFLKNLV